MEPDDIAIEQVAKTIPIRNVWYMLLYAWDMAHWKGRFNAEAEDAPSLLGLLAKILAESTEHLVRQQLRRSHEPRHEIIRGIRGRIDFATCIKKRTFERGTASCHFSELSVDTLKNRIILATLYRLSHDRRLAFPNKTKEAEHLCQRLNLLVHEMQEVKLSQIGTSDFSRLQLTRNDQEYYLPITICSMIHRLEMPTESAGDHALVALLRDEIVFNELFERFVCNFYRYKLEPEFKVRYQQQLSWPDDLKNQYAPVMRTDITLEKQGTNSRTIVDTKYSKTTLVASQHGTEKIKSGDLYQLYAYLRTQEDKDLAARNASGVLIYPTTKYDVHEKMYIQGHGIGVETLNLTEPWLNIEHNLMSIVC